MDPQANDRAQLPRNMIENSMFEEEPDVVDLAKESNLNPLESDDVEYEPRSSRLLVRGLGEHDLDEDEEDYESSAKLLGMSFMNRSSGLRNSGSNFRHTQEGLCPVPSARTVICTFTKEGCHVKNHSMELIYPIASNGKVFPWAKNRLPHSVLPLQYNITLHPNMSTMAFTGLVQIKLNVTENTKNIILHSSGLHITKASVLLEGKSLEKVEVLEYPAFEEIAVILPEPIIKGKECILSLGYSANFSSSYYGFYKVSYMDGNSSRWLAATQFEPLAARKAFPCFDEPAFKSTFLIRIKRNEEHISLSNMPKIETTTVADGVLQDEFSTSVAMSTYLVAFIVADMKNVSKETNDTMVSVYAIPQKMDQVQYALESAVKLLDFYTKYFEIKYPLKKLDLVAIPDIQAGAMENWGLITFRETTLLYGENISSVMDKQEVTMVIAHELAHQWFGNLVTMEWWNDVWLNEGFATYMQYFSLQSAFPDLNADDGFLKQRFKALEKDALITSHPISTDVQSPQHIEEMFDDLSYIKGAAILLMLKNYLSEDIFHFCIKQYLNNYEYRSATSDGLWESMNLLHAKLYIENVYLSQNLDANQQKLKNTFYMLPFLADCMGFVLYITQSNPDMKNLMKSWTHQAGYPLVTAIKKGKEIHLSQERFLRTNNPTENSSTVWHVPLSYITSDTSETAFKNVYLLNDVKDKINLTSENSWVKFNVRMTGFYLVDYGDEGWNGLIGQLNSDHTVLHSDDRANLIHDIFVLGGVGRVPLTKAFDLLSYIVNETNVAPIRQVIHQLSHIHGILDKRGETLLAGRVMHNTLDLLKNQIKNQSWTDEGTLSERELRSTLLDFACSYDFTDCTSKAAEWFDKWKNNGTQLPTDVMKVVYKVGAKTEEGWGYLFEVYASSMFETEKLKILEALASTDNARKLLWLMQESLRGNLIRSQDLHRIITFISRHVPGYLVAWDFVKQNWDEINQKFQPGSYIIQTVVTKTTYQFSTETYLNEVISFFNSTSGKSRDMWCVKEAIETIKMNIQWIKQNLDSIKNWL